MQLANICSLGFVWGKCLSPAHWGCCQQRNHSRSHWEEPGGTPAHILYSLLPCPISASTLPRDIIVPLNRQEDKDDERYQIHGGCSDPAASTLPWDTQPKDLVMESFYFSETWLESYLSISMTNGKRSSVVSTESGSHSLPGPCCHFLWPQAGKSTSKARKFHQTDS